MRNADLTIISEPIPSLLPEPLELAEGIASLRTRFILDYRDPILNHLPAEMFLLRDYPADHTEILLRYFISQWDAWQSQSISNAIELPRQETDAVNHLRRQFQQHKAQSARLVDEARNSVPTILGAIGAIRRIEASYPEDLARETIYRNPDLYPLVYNFLRAYGLTHLLPTLQEQAIEEAAPEVIPAAGFVLDEEPEIQPVVEQGEILAKEERIRLLLDLVEQKAQATEPDESGHIHNFINLDVARTEIDFYREWYERIERIQGNTERRMAKKKYYSSIKRDLSTLSRRIDSENRFTLVREEVNIEYGEEWYLRYNPELRSHNKRTLFRVVPREFAIAEEPLSEVPEDIEPSDDVYIESVVRQVTEQFSLSPLESAIARMFFKANYPVSVERIIYDQYRSKYDEYALTWLTADTRNREEILNEILEDYYSLYRQIDESLNSFLEKFRQEFKVVDVDYPAFETYFWKYTDYSYDQINNRPHKDFADAVEGIIRRTYASGEYNFRALLLSSDIEDRDIENGSENNGILIDESLKTDIDLFEGKPVVEFTTRDFGQKIYLLTSTIEDMSDLKTEGHMNQFKKLLLGINSGTVEFHKIKLDSTNSIHRLRTRGEQSAGTRMRIMLYKGDIEGCSVYLVVDANWKDESSYNNSYISALTKKGQRLFKELEKEVVKQKKYNVK